MGLGPGELVSLPWLGVGESHAHGSFGSNGPKSLRRRQSIPNYQIPCAPAWFVFRHVFILSE
jgi:hypothetical protein